MCEFFQVERVRIRWLGCWVGVVFGWRAHPLDRLGEHRVDDVFTQRAVALELILVEPLVGGALGWKRRIRGGVGPDVGGLIAGTRGLEVDECPGTTGVIDPLVVDPTDGAVPCTVSGRRVGKELARVDLDVDAEVGPALLDGCAEGGAGAVRVWNERAIAPSVTSDMKWCFVKSWSDRNSICGRPNRLVAMRGPRSLRGWSMSWNNPAG